MDEHKPSPGATPPEIAEPGASSNRGGDTTGSAETPPGEAALARMQRRKLTITPTTGACTNFYIGALGEDNTDPENVKERVNTTIIDGVKAAEEGYTVFMDLGYINAIASETLRSEGYPVVGIKIHVALNPDDDSYRDKLLKLAELCLEPDPNGNSTSFKVKRYSRYRSVISWDPDQARKLVTIYPNYLVNQRINVAETVRLVAGLRKIMGADTQGTKDDNGIFGEHRAGNRIYLRAGALTKEGEAYESVSRTAPFEEQVHGNLASPETDAELFSREITKAIAEGRL